MAEARSCDLISNCFQSEEITEESPEVIIPNILDEFLVKIKSDNEILTRKEVEVTLNNHFKDLKETLLEKIDRGNTGGRGGGSSKIALKKIAATVVYIIIFALYVNACLYTHDPAQRLILHGWKKEKKKKRPVASQATAPRMLVGKGL
ncbi:uncharacterized protein LOC122020606 [Zingiber officinale]|uniref:uncharacterized protein LOC122020606 n=1 Tax=Zingiber officinale TaxID=94328 RepID=UPI001C4D466F|nr:uncharacterized protein LOC122020606 [Zingiber officinale]